MSYLFQVFNSSFEIYISYWFSKSNSYPTIDFQNLTLLPTDFQNLTPTTLLIFKNSPYHTIDFQNLTLPHYWFSKPNPYHTIDFQNLPTTTLLIFKTSPLPPSMRGR